MDMLRYKSLIEEGDLVIVYLDVRHMYPLTVKRDVVFQSKYGALKHNDIIGKKFGSVVSCTRGYVYVLFPTPELWTITLPHRTQILYAADISLIILQLDLKPGCVVCEAGTGSGSLSHALIRAIAPNGFLHTFDFHEKRVEDARKEFEDHGLSKLVKVEHRDVCSDGFGLTEEADAVFLDLPNPWVAIPHAVKTLKHKVTGSRICSFSPCIEQVQRTCKALQQHNFHDIVTVECLQRTYEVKKITQTIISFGRNVKREAESTSSNVKREAESTSSNIKREAESTSSNVKREAESSSSMDTSANTSMEEISDSQTAEKNNSSSNKCETVTHWAAVPPFQTPGHTGFLTYASLCSS